MAVIRMPRPLYIACRVGEMFVGLVSRAINGSLPGGSTFQTLSARSHIETNTGWLRARRIINAMFFWQPDHCAAKWQREIENAEKTLRKVKGK